MSDPALPATGAPSELARGLARGHRLIRMSGRSTEQDHRVATRLELLFALTFVVAFGFAGNELAHAIVTGQVGDGLIGFAFAMFATCWAWIRYHRDGHRIRADADRDGLPVAAGGKAVSGESAGSAHLCGGRPDRLGGADLPGPHGAAAALSAVIEVEHGWTPDVALVGLAGIALALGMWWPYFTLPSGEALQVARRKSFVWGYGRILVFAGIAATGARLHVAALQMEQGGRRAVGGRERTAERHRGGAGDGDPGCGLHRGAVRPLYLSVGEFDRFHLLLLGGNLLVLAVSALLTAAGSPLPVCLVLLLLAPAPAPAITIVGYETLGHADQAAVLDRLRQRAAASGEAARGAPLG